MAFIAQNEVRLQMMQGFDCITRGYDCSFGFLILEDSNA
jgi:hypothetical protein